MKNELELKNELKNINNYLKYQKHLNKDKNQIVFSREKFEAIEKWIDELTDYVYVDGSDEDPDEDRLEKFQNIFGFPNDWTVSITDFWVIKNFINFLLEDENE